MHALLARKLIVASLTLSASAAAAAGAGFIGATPETAPDPLAPPAAEAAVEAADAPHNAAQFAGVQPADIAHSFYFTRAAYPSGGFGRGGGGWATDWPQADHTIISVLGRLTNVDVYPREHAVRLDDPDLRRFPFLYAVEVGRMNLRDFEVEALRNYLLAGGFMMVDDFWGDYQFANFQAQMRRVLPEFDIVDIPLDHPIFSTVYQVDEIVQVPVVDRGIYGGPTHEQGGIVPHCMGIFDEKGRLMVVINWNTDLGDAWEWAEHPQYPLEYSTYAYRMGANFIFYAMTR